VAKEQVRHLSAVFISIFAQSGYITKEEAKEISGLDGHEFEKAYDAATTITGKTKQAKGQKRDRFMEHFF